MKVTHTEYDGEIVTYDSKTISATKAFEILEEELGSGEDPIYYLGKETTTNDLAATLDLQSGLDTGPRAAQVRISYYGLESPITGGIHLWKGSNLKQMLEDRLAKDKIPAVSEPQTLAVRRVAIRRRIQKLLVTVDTATHARLDDISAKLIRI